MTAPARTAPARTYVWPSRILIIIAGICLLFAALTAAGSSILSGPMWAWGFGGLSAWALAYAVP
jgi:hypothetical protein